MEHIQYLFKGASQESKEILVALLSEIGFEAFEEKDDLLFGFTSQQILKDEIDEIVSLTDATYSSSVIKEQNWNEKWESGFDPVSVYLQKDKRVFVHIRASFHPPDASSRYEIIITPKMSFGTGHHDTTSGMIEYMSQVDFNGRNVIDFGTGTGVLAILAEKLGAANIIAIDHDLWSIRNAEENISVNNCVSITLKQADQYTSDIQADIILANINLNVIMNNLDQMVRSCHHDTVMILSGMLETDKPLITEALNKHGMGVRHIYVKNKWLVLMAGRMY